jgi:hypothetical protein
MPEDFRAEQLLSSLRSFKLRDVYFPDSDEVISKTTPDLKLHGTIIDFSDGGLNKNEYAILQVEGIEGPVVVPVSKLRSLLEEDEADIRLPD